MYIADTVASDFTLDNRYFIILVICTCFACSIIMCNHNTKSFKVKVNILCHKKHSTTTNFSIKNALEKTYIFTPKEMLLACL